MADRTAEEMRVLLLAPTSKDAHVSRTLLESEGLRCQTCDCIQSICERLQEGAGGILLPEEAILSGKGAPLAKLLTEQPPWSSIPVIVLTAAGSDSAIKVRSILEFGNVTILKRPLEVTTFVNAVRAALRDRERQYQVRDYLSEQKATAQRIQEQDDRLQFALAAGRLGSWDLDLATNALTCSEICKSNYGRPKDSPFSYDDVFAAIHPEDRTRVRATLAAAITSGIPYDIEYRTVWPDETVHWVLVRGRLNGTTRLSGVSLDITEQKRAEEVLREADRKKDDFIALLAHELRNPLAPLRNGLQVMRLAGEDVQAVNQARAMMDRQLTHMVRLIDDLLDVSRISRHKMELRKARVLLADIITAAVETASPLMESLAHELEVAIPPGPVLLDADLTRLSQVFSNLLTNSAKYTPPGGRIQLCAEVHEQGLTVTVSDNGIGIPSHLLASIFDMFSQVDRPIERSSGGLGIGLSLVKGLVEMHGGSVFATSEGHEQGSTFTVRLPLMESTPIPHSHVSSNVHARHRVLVVDDNRDGAASLAMMLKLLGDEVLTAHDGIEAIAAAEQFQPEVILMDVGMPRLNGLEATRRIREQAWGQDIKIIALTGWGQDTDRMHSRDAGCNGHLVKPVNLPDLEALLNQVSSAPC